ncbi:hypothetical protein QQP08_003314 [Theobroma cacao]|nr:hypothetical protein QQP08_003314 [Theobroma cacao]
MMALLEAAQLHGGCNAWGIIFTALLAKKVYFIRLMTSAQDNLEDRMGSHERWRTALSSTYSPDLSGGRVGMDLTSHGGLAYAVYIMMNTMMKN